MLTALIGIAPSVLLMLATDAQGSVVRASPNVATAYVQAILSHADCVFNEAYNSLVRALSAFLVESHYVFGFVYSLYLIYLSGRRTMIISHMARTKHYEHIANLISFESGLLTPFHRSRTYPKASSVWYAGLPLPLHLHPKSSNPRQQSVPTMASSHSNNAGSGQQIPLSPSQIFTDDANFDFDNMGIDFNFETNIDEFDKTIENMNDDGTLNAGSGFDINAGAMAQSFDQSFTVPNSMDHGFGTANPSQLMLNQGPQEMVPMQKKTTFAPAAPAAPMGFSNNSVQPTPTMPVPTPPPGYAYHPAVGWYMPVAQPLAQSPAYGAPFNDFAPQNALTFSAPFATSPAPMMQQPAGVSFEVEPLENSPAVSDALKGAAKRRNARSRSQKRKYGPDVYTKYQAELRAEGHTGGPRPVSRDSVSFYVAPKPGSTPPKAAAEDAEGSDYKGKSKSKAKKSRPKRDTPAPNVSDMKELKEAIVQVCHCPSAQQAAAAHIPRPRNAFIIFRADFAARFRPANGRKGAENAKLSKEAANAWARLSEIKGGQDPYRKRAEIEKKKHEETYPDYIYTPASKIQVKFGSPTECVCGAYAANQANLERKRAGGATPPNFGVMPHAEFVGQRTRSRSRSAESGVPRQPFQAPVAQMFAPSRIDPTGGTPQVHFSTERQQIEYAQAIAHKRAAVAAPEEEEPIAKRRSARHATHVDYAEPADEDMDSLFLSQDSPRSKRRPSASRAQSISSTMSSVKSADFRLEIDGPPSERTRSKSIDSNISELSDLASQFDDAEGESEDEMADNIVVATPNKNRASPRSSPRLSPRSNPAKKGLALPPKPAGVSKRPATRSQSRGRSRKRS